MDQVEGVVAGDAGQVEVLGEDQHQKHDHGAGHRRLGQAHGGDGGLGGADARQAHALVPMAHAPEHQDRDHRGQRAPGDRAVAVGQHHRGGQERPQRRSEVAADLEQRLGQSRPGAGRHPGHARTLRVEHRRPHADHAGRDHRHRIVLRQAEQQEAHEGEDRAARQGEGHRPAVGDQSHHRLQQGGGELEGEGEQADLAEAEMEAGLQGRIDGRQQRLHHVVEHVAEADGEDDPEGRPGHVGGAGAARGNPGGGDCGGGHGLRV